MFGTWLMLVLIVVQFAAAGAGLFSILRGNSAGTTILGPFLGGVLVDTISRRAAFLINVPLIVIALFALRAVPESRDEESDGADGFVSIEVEPDLAGDSEATLERARHLWQRLGRPNVFVKIPATPEGLPAIETAIAEGININITLLFSVDVYREVARAYIDGLRERQAAGGDIRSVASVASFFVSRVDTKVDKALDEIGSEAALAARGQAAIANAKLAYHAYKEIFEGDEFADLEAAGARVQRCLWASTSAKNPVYRDVMYAEELIGPKTVDTLPNETIEAFLDHGVVSRTLDVGLDEAIAAIRAVEGLGIRMETVTDELTVEGVAAFTKSFEDLMGVIDAQRKALAPA